MGYYTEYLNTLKNFDSVSSERKNQLSIISKLRNNIPILAIASDLSKPGSPTSIDYSDILPIANQIKNLEGNSIDVILETPGGSGEIAEDIVKLLRNKFDNVSFIIPGWCKSAGTIIAMSGNEILMDEVSALGPIDAQISRNGKTFSAHAFIEGLEKIKEEAIVGLNRAYIPILQNISPGEIKDAEHAMSFAKVLVSSWLKEYKFAKWDIHASTGQPVTPEEKKARAEVIAEQLCDHGKWLTHGRSIKLKDLEEMRVKITDMNSNPDLKEAVWRYYALLRMTFESTTIYKLFETIDSQVLRFQVPKSNGKQKVPSGDIKIIKIDLECEKCKHKTKVQGNLVDGIPIEDGYLPFPIDNQFQCPNCQRLIDLSNIRRDAEAKIGRRIL